MSSIQERLQLKRVPLDTWNVREQLCLASAVVRSGDQNWMSVSRALKTVGEPNRPPDWYSQKSCAAQYGALLEHVETPKRKKRNSEGGVETPQESILKRLTQQRIQEIQSSLSEMNTQYEQLKNEIAETRNQSTPDDRIQELWAGIETAKRARERENARRAAWLKEREERRARAERTWRPPQTPPPTTASPSTPSSPLLTSLLKSSPVVTTPQHIPHPATVVDAVSPSAGAPTLSLLLEQPVAAQDNKHAAIEHIKSQLVQIEHQLKANTQPVAPVIQAPSVDIDDIEIKAEDVYAFSDIDIHIPPVATMHKGPVRTPEKQTSKKEDTSLPEPAITDVVIEDVKEEPIAAQEFTEEPISADIEMPEEKPIHEEQKPIEEPKPIETEVVKITFPEVKFPTPEIKVIQPDEQKTKEEVKEPEIPVQEDTEKIPEEKAEVEQENVEQVTQETAQTEEKVENQITEEEIANIPEPETEPRTQEVVTEAPDPQDIPLPPEERPTEVINEPTEDIKPEPPTEEPKATEEIEEKKTEEQKTEKGKVIEIEGEKVDKREIAEVKEEIETEEVKRDEDAEDSIPLKEMMRDEIAQEEIKREGLEEDTHTETDDDTPMELSREEEKDGKTKRDYSRKKKSDSRTCSGSESAPESPSASDAERQHRLWKKSVMLVYSRLCAHKYASLFLRPITDEEAPGYSVVVKRPMDLTNIRRNIDNGNIRTTAEFQRDVLLMLSNALLYNSSSHSVYAMAKEMQEEARTQLGMLVAAQAHAGLLPPRRKRRALQDAPTGAPASAKGARTD